jgi:DNA-binding response OmpR family regulator
MTLSPLNGLSFLVVEDQPLIALDIAQAFQTTGAHVTQTNTLRHAMILADYDGLSGAVLDHALGDGNSAQLYARLRERGIPFLIYSGFDPGHDHMPVDVPFLQKPASNQDLIAAMEDLIRTQQRRL